jgi:hypothetical protein
MNLKDLTQFIPSYKWRVQSVSKNYPAASCVAYIDARDVMYILDEIVGPENWQSDYKEIKGNLYAGIAVKINGEWVWKWDCGTESNTEKEKGEASDAFKRAAVKWGIGRFLYDLPIQYVKTNDKKGSNNYPYPVDENGRKIGNLTTYLNENVKAIPQITEISYFPVKKNGNGHKALSSPAEKQEITEEKVQAALNEVKRCKTKEKLREIRHQYKELLGKSDEFKKALTDRYEILK